MASEDSIERALRIESADPVVRDESALSETVDDSMPWRQCILVYTLAGWSPVKIAKAIGRDENWVKNVIQKNKGFQRVLRAARRKRDADALTIRERVEFNAHRALDVHAQILGRDTEQAITDGRLGFVALQQKSAESMLDREGSVPRQLHSKTEGVVFHLTAEDIETLQGRIDAAREKRMRVMGDPKIIEIQAETP